MRWPALWAGMAALAFATGAVAQQAETFPNRPIKIVVTQAAGSGMDIQARIIAQKMGELWGQPGVVENRAGANGILGMDSVAKAKPDGYTLVYASASVLAMNPFIYKNMPYDMNRDFAPVTQTGANPMGVVVNPSLGVNSLKELVDLAKSKPGELNFGSFGIGNMTHLMGEMLSNSASIKMTHVPYRGQTPAVSDLLGGQVQMVFTTLAGVTDLVESGKLKLLATFGDARDEQFPNVPTVKETYPDVIMVGWSGILAPTGVPPAVLNRLQGGIAQSLAAPDVKGSFLKQGARAVPSTPDQFDRFIKAEAQKFSAVIKGAGLEGSQ